MNLLAALTEQKIEVRSLTDDDTSWLVTGTYGGVEFTYRTSFEAGNEQQAARQMVALLKAEHPEVSNA
jgi:hypothetical protein